jgi:hypothetical protein
MNPTRGIMLCVLLAATARAQSTAGVGAGMWAADLCADSAKSTTFAQCGLMLSDDRLLRGASASVVTIGEPLSPIRLSRYVRGDTALHYALIYERQSRTGALLRFTGGSILLVESILIVSHTANTSTRDGKVNVVPTTIMLSGLAVLAASAPFRFVANRNGERAVAAHNQGLSR